MKNKCWLNNCYYKRFFCKKIIGFYKIEHDHNWYVNVKYNLFMNMYKRLFFWFWIFSQNINKNNEIQVGLKELNLYIKHLVESIYIF